ncbi:MAG: thiol-disulfide oxidoreductase DCC family protein [Bosea sp.]|uniref:thiol-disulfide oxidoreductase DCC family protein n=1 Tax=Bosea sp. (in: a-proteobacteria) TaxID=1871050 RepID=UPI0023A20442|nr:thiol-disulfide oxidoreductase DCC family protein [Bosea sp. (in: a-proteobacteria)]MCP4740069.1 thiol-disulfide oxidoreductase DCC family protein [Bosea sp. (in: a-proteobacteria)]
MTSPAAPIWLYDGVCVLCSGGVRYTLLHERDHEIRFVAIQSAEGRALAQAHGIDPDEPDSFLFIENGEALAKSAGVLALIRHLNGPVRLLLLGRALPKAWRDWLYDRVARNRYRLFGQKASCEMPDPAVRQRFTLPESR